MFFKKISRCFKILSPVQILSHRFNQPNCQFASSCLRKAPNQFALNVLLKRIRPKKEKEECTMNYERRERRSFFQPRFSALKGGKEERDQRGLSTFMFIHSAADLFTALAITHHHLSLRFSLFCLSLLLLICFILFCFFVPDFAVFTFSVSRYTHVYLRWPIGRYERERDRERERE